MPRYEVSKLPHFCTYNQKYPDFSGFDISGSIGNRNKGSSVLYSPGASDHFYSHQNYWITILIFLIQSDILMPEIIQRPDQLSKSVGSFGIRCGLWWVLGGLTGTISSWAFPEKTAKKTPEKLIFGYQNHKLSAWPLLYFLLMADI